MQTVMTRRQACGLTEETTPAYNMQGQAGFAPIYRGTHPSINRRELARFCRKLRYFLMVKKRPKWA